MATKEKVNIVGIVAWVLVVVFAAAAGTLGFLGKKQSGRAAGLGDALAQVAATAGVADLAPEALQDPAALPDVLQKAQGAIQAVQQELAATKESLNLARGEASTAKTEAGNLSQKAQELTARAEALAKDLAAKEEAAAAAKAEADKAVQEAKAAQEAAEQRTAELDGEVAGLKDRLAEETARLQAELEALRAQAAARQAPAGEMLVEAGGEGAAAAEVEEPGRIIGQSEILSLIRYDEAEQSLYLRLLDGQELTYREVPPAAFARLVADGDKTDVVYKFKIQGTFKSLPPDSTVLRKYWKWQRRNPAKGDLRVIELAAPVEEVPAEEPAAAPAE